jgi:hypothetical protein
MYYDVGMGEEDRRNTVRHLTWFPVEVDTGGRDVIAAARNISEGGMLLATHKRIGEGKPVRLALHVDPGMQEPHVLEGRVVRAFRNAGDPAALWGYKLAVEFEDADPHLVASVLEDA